MKTQSIIIGISVLAAVVFGGLFLRQISKTGAANERVKQKEELLKRNQILTDYLKVRVQADSVKLLSAMQNLAKSTARENIYADKIKIDSLILKEVKNKNNEIDSLSDHYSLGDWDCYIANQISEDCNN